MRADVRASDREIHIHQIKGTGCKSGGWALREVEGSRASSAEFRDTPLAEGKGVNKVKNTNLRVSAREKAPTRRSSGRTGVTSFPTSSND